jgi:hypothetical protein
MFQRAISGVRSVQFERLPCARVLCARYMRPLGRAETPTHAARTKPGVRRGRQACRRRLNNDPGRLWTQDVFLSENTARSRRSTRARRSPAVSVPSSSRCCSIHCRISTLGRTCCAAARCRIQSSIDFGSRPAATLLAPDAQGLGTFPRRRATAQSPRHRGGLRHPRPLRICGRRIVRVTAAR